MVAAASAPTSWAGPWSSCFCPVIQKRHQIGMGIGGQVLLGERGDPNLLANHVKALHSVSRPAPASPKSHSRHLHWLNFIVPGSR